MTVLGDQMEAVLPVVNIKREVIEEEEYERWVLMQSGNISGG